MPNAPSVKKVKYVLLAPKKPPKVQSVFQPNEETLVVENVPNANVCGMLRPRVKVLPKAKMQSVHNSRVNNTVNKAGKESSLNQSTSSTKGINSAPKLFVRKDQGLVQEDSKGVPTAPSGIGDNNKAIPKVSASKPPDPKASVQENNSLR